jgi:hypothetical protein
MTDWNDMAEPGKPLHQFVPTLAGEPPSMRSHLRMPKPAWLFMFPPLLWAAIVMGCDSGPDLNDPAVKKYLAARREAVQRQEAVANKALQKRFGKKAPAIKLIRGAIGTGQPPAQ